MCACIQVIRRDWNKIGNCSSVHCQRQKYYDLIQSINRKQTNESINQSPTLCTIIMMLPRMVWFCLLVWSNNIVCSMHNATQRHLHPTIMWGEICDKRSIETIYKEEREKEGEANFVSKFLWAPLFESWWRHAVDTTCRTVTSSSCSSSD